MEVKKIPQEKTLNRWLIHFEIARREHEKQGPEQLAEFAKLHHFVKSEGYPEAIRKIKRLDWFRKASYKTQDHMRKVMRAMEFREVDYV